MKKSSFFITKNIGILLLWLASSGSLDCFYALIKIYNFIKIMFFQVAFLDFQNLQEWGRRINDTYTKMNGISEVRPSIFGGRRQIIRPCTLAGHVSTVFRVCDWLPISANQSQTQKTVDVSVVVNSSATVENPLLVTERRLSYWSSSLQTLCGAVT